VKVKQEAFLGSHKSCTGVKNPCEGAEPVQPVASEIRGIVLEAAWPPVPGEPVSAVIQRAARRLQLGYSRARCYYYNLVRMVPAEEADRLRAAHVRLMTERLARIDAEAAVIRARLSNAA
jgi:hypothetical protein